MSRNKQADGTKIAQAAKDLNVTSVTIRRYLTEFNIETMSDENGIKVLPAQAMEELQEVRRLKEDGMTNPKVMEFLEERRTKSGGDAKPEKPKGRAKAKVVESKPVASKARKVEEVEEEEDEEEEVVVPIRKVAAAKPVKKPTARRVAKAEVVEAEEEAVAPVAAEVVDSSDADDELSGDESEGSDDNRSKHSLTCQTCGKVFEHMNPRLRDCLDCYRAKRKERRRGGADRHKNVIQHPLAQQAAAKAPSAIAAELAASAPSAPAARQRDFSPAASAPARERDRDRDRGADRERIFDRDRGADREREREFVAAPAPSSAPLVQRGPVRNYRKAIEETRQITGSLKRRLERPDLPEGERRWLEQIYAYQLILHQGWRHLSEYKSAGQNQSGRTED